MITAKSILKAAPLCCCLFLVAAEDECTIRIVGPEPDDCVSREEFCPDLQCDEYAVDEDGCELCECVDPVDPSECSSDADCREGQYCAFVEACPPCVDAEPACEIACEARGVCQDIVVDPCANLDCPPGMWCELSPDGQAQCVGEPGCWSDMDCREGEICQFTDGCYAGPGGLVACPGQCVPSNPVTCENVRCEAGTHCVESSQGPMCVADESQCAEDADCGTNQHCEQICAPDPNCPMCDVCMMVGVCVDNGCPALCGPGSECVVNPDGTVGCVPVEPRCYSDQDCADGLVCNAEEVCLPPADCDATGNCPDVCTGFCVVPTCQDDSQCAADEVCVLETNCAPCAPGENCLVPCFVEGHCAPRQ